MINWKAEVEKRKKTLLSDLQGLVQIPSVLDESAKEVTAPLGTSVKEALDYMLTLGERDGFHTKNVGHVAGHLEMGAGEGLIGVLGHVDVVPAGDGWSVDPFAGVVKDGKLIARGAIDDKGPTIAAYYGMKIVKELGLPLKKRVRLIIGTDEESDWRCVERYFKEEEMPEMGFAPDADFPIIHAEKGILDFDIVQTGSPSISENREHRLISFESGLRYNMVPDFARAVVDISNGHTDIMQMYNDFLSTQNLKGKYYVDGGYSVIELEGVAAHGSEPDKGKNAGLLLASFLATLELDERGSHFIDFIITHFFGDSKGRALGVQFYDEVSGELTINVGRINYNEAEGGSFGITMRYPVTFGIDEGIETMRKRVSISGYSLANLSNSSPHHVAQDHPLIQILQKVYKEQTGEKPELLSIGGGTYARSLTSGVAFGALFPGKPDVAHQKDEYIDLDDLLRATAIYAQAIYELTQID